MTDINARYASDVALKRVQDQNLYSIFCTKEEEEKAALAAAAGKQQKNDVENLQQVKEGGGGEDGKKKVNGVVDDINDTKIATAASIKKIHWDNIQIEKTLGEGRFARVYLVTVIDDDDIDYSIEQDKKDEQEKKDKEYYALKKIKGELIEETTDKKILKAIAIDTIMEVKLLSMLCDHPNIITLFGMRNSQPTFPNPSFRSNGFFMLLECLAGGTLDDKLYDWKLRMKYNKQQEFILQQKLLEQEQQEQGENHHHDSGSLRKIKKLIHHTHSNHSHHNTKDNKSNHSNGHHSGPFNFFGIMHSNRSNDDHNDDEDDIIEEEDVKDIVIPSMVQRIQILLGIAKGMEYIHSKDIIFRDLKLENIGFSKDLNDDITDSSSDVKIFDFGISSELQYFEEEKEEKEDLFQMVRRKSTRFLMSAMGNTDFEDDDDESYNHRKLTGKTGTVRYMAPENLLSKPYSLPNDVYAFAMIMWELISLDRVFKHKSNDDIIQLHTTAVNANDNNDDDNNTNRPSLVDGDISYRISDSLKELIVECWDAKPKKRPTFKQIRIELENDLANNKLFYSKEEEKKRQDEYDAIKRIQQQHEEQEHENEEGNESSTRSVGHELGKMTKNVQDGWGKMIHGVESMFH